MPRIRVHVIVEMGGNKTKAVNFCLVEECDRYDAWVWGDLCEAGRVGFLELVSEDPLRKGVFAVQDEGSGFSVAKEPGENVVCHRHAIIGCENSSNLKPLKKSASIDIIPVTWPNRDGGE